MSLDREQRAVGLIVLGDALDKREHLAALVETCPPPLHQWFSDQRQRIAALALEAIAAGTIAHDQGAVMGYLSHVRWHAALDVLQGRPLVLDAGAEPGETALVGARIATLLADAAAARFSDDGLTYGRPVRAIGILRNLAQRRRLSGELAKAASAVARVGFGEDVGPHVSGLMGALRGFASASGDRSLGEALNSALRAAAHEAGLRASGRARPLTWGVAALDRALPLRPGRLVVLSARPGGGKTSLALQAAHRTAAGLGRHSVAFLSLEMSGEQLALVLACREVQVPRRQAEEAWETLLPADQGELRAIAAQWTADAALWIRDAAAGRPTVASIVAWIRQQKHRHGGVLELVVVDYLGLIQALNPRLMLGERVAEITGALKQAALAENVAVLLLAQLTREGRKAGRDGAGRLLNDPEPRVEDLYGGSAIESDADAVLFLHPQPSVQSDVRQINALIAKHRHGPPGCIELAFFAAHQHFQDWQRPEAGERASRLASAPQDSEDVF